MDDIAQVTPGEQRDECRLVLILLSSAAVGAAVALLYVFAGFVWGAVATAVLLAAACWCVWRYLRAAAPVLPEEGTKATGGGGGFSEVDVEAAIPSFQYQRKAAAEQCAVCISAVREGDRMRRLPPCGHAFHAPCVDAWLHAHATCPMCRAVVVAGEKKAEAAAE